MNTSRSRISNLWQPWITRYRIERDFPFLRSYRTAVREVADTIEPSHSDYIARVSNGLMAISLRTASFLYVFCRETRPRAILDLGSGFSSYVLRLYAAQNPGVTVCSVDDSEEWLQYTRTYLAERGVTTESVMSFAEFRDCAPQDFDLIFHDLGNMEIRTVALPLVVDLMIRCRSATIFDDMHKTRYARAVKKAVRSTDHRRYSLKEYTLDDFGRYCDLVVSARQRSM